MIPKDFADFLAKAQSAYAVQGFRLRGARLGILEFDALSEHIRMLAFFTPVLHPRPSVIEFNGIHCTLFDPPREAGLEFEVVKQEGVW